MLAAEEWVRIKDSLSSGSVKAELRQAQLDARRTLHQHSKAIVSNWENTIEVCKPCSPGFHNSPNLLLSSVFLQGQRLKKLQAKKIREEKEEVGVAWLGGFLGDIMISQLFHPSGRKSESGC